MDIERIIAIVASIVAAVSSSALAWVRITKRRDEARGSLAQEEKVKAETEATQVDTAIQMVDLLGKQAVQAEAARAEAVKHVGVLQLKVADLLEDNASVIAQNRELRSGAQRLVGQIVGLGYDPIWQPTQTAPMPITFQTQQLVREIIEQNHIAQALGETQAEDKKKE